MCRKARCDFLRRIFADAINDGQRRNDDFARGERTQDADADLPVETERLDRRLNRAANFSSERILQGALSRQMVGVDAKSLPPFGVAGFFKLRGLRRHRHGGGGRRRFWIMRQRPQQQRNQQNDRAGLFHENFCAVKRVQQRRAQTWQAIRRQFNDQRPAAARQNRALKNPAPRAGRK